MDIGTKFSVDFKYSNQKQEAMMVEENNENQTANSPKKENVKQTKWIIPPALNKVLEKFKAVCDTFFKEDEHSQKTNPIMICGQTGVGKSCFTDYFIERYYQHYPDKKGTTTVRFNCAAIPEGLAESILFGHIKGAFTGAVKTVKGIFDESDKLVILEEIGELPQYIQAKLLILIEQGTFMRVGDNSEQQFNGQIIATTNKTQEDFRSDFYFRFFPFFVPALHERRSDILYYFYHFDSEIFKLLSISNVTALLSYHWPGNVREIKRFCRLFRINSKQHVTKYVNKDVTKHDIYDEHLGMVSFTDLPKLFIIPEKYSKFKINSPLIFLEKLQRENNTDEFNSYIEQFEKMIDYYIGFTNEDSPFKEDLEYLQVIEQSIATEIAKKKQANFYTVTNKEIDIIAISYHLFCILFFRDIRANHDLLDFENFTVPKINIIAKNFKMFFPNLDEAKLSEISLEILSLFSKIPSLRNEKRKKLPLEYNDRKEVIKQIYEKNKDNKFLSELVGIPKDRKSSDDIEIDIKTLKEKDVIKTYYGILHNKIGLSNKAIAKIAGLSEPTITQKLNKYEIKKGGSTLILKIYKEQ